MQVILLDKIPKLGEMGDEVDVRSGYARNYLFPQKKAVRVTPENLVYFQEHREALQRVADERRAVAEKRAAELQELGVVTIAVNVDENDHLYGSVGPREISKALQDAGIVLHKEEIVLPSVLRVAGEHEVVLRLHSEVDLRFKVALIPAESP